MEGRRQKAEGRRDLPQRHRGHRDQKKGDTMTPEEYLVLEDAAPYRSEYDDGAMIAMVDRSHANAVINMNVTCRLHQISRDRSWRVFGSNMRVCIEPLPLYTYPDASVTWDPPTLAANSNTTLINPCLIVEVHPPAGECYRRRATFRQFQKIGTLRDYVAVSQAGPHVGHYSRLNSSPERWLYTVYEGVDAALSLPTLQVELPLREIYEGVEFSRPGSTESKKHPDHAHIF